MRSLIAFFSAMFLIITLNSCELVGGIFEAGFNTAIFLVILVVVVILIFVFRARRKS
jgi:hypothetical protein